VTSTAVARATMQGKLVQHWVESGKIANEQELSVDFTIVDGLITRIEMLPGG
jgi:hypothetical protein